MQSGRLETLARESEGDTCSVQGEIAVSAELIGLTFARCGGLANLFVIRLGALEGALPRDWCRLKGSGDLDKSLLLRVA